jgi:RNA polymerase sigma factor (sigma-70 family)
MREDDLSKLYEDCYGAMVAYVMRKYGFNQSDAQEIASQALLEELSPGGSKFDPSRNVPFIVWMVRKASFRAHDELRKRKHRKTYIHIDAEELGIKGDPGIETPQARNRKKLLQALPERLRIIFELTSHGYSAEEIARMLEMKIMRVRYLQRTLRTAVVQIAKELELKPEDLFDER